MRTHPPLLLPLFRSDGQARLLARLYLSGDRPAPLADLARELQVDKGGLAREADRLERAGLIRSERVGRSRILHPNEDSPYYPELAGLLLKAFGPATLIGPELARVDGIERACLFGSWAARYLGDSGHDPVDIDVIVVGRPSRIALSGAERTLSDALGRELNTTIVTPDEWEAAESGFLKEVQRGPLVELQLDRDEEAH